MIAVVDYGVGNLFSLASSLKYIGEESVVTSDSRVLKNARSIILPGVGAFGDAMKKLERTGLIPALDGCVQEGKPLLGICLGMQALFEKSYEYGEHLGLSYLKGEVCPMDIDLASEGFSLKVPAIGWNALCFERKDSPLLRNSKEGDYVYYVHSYYAKHCEDEIIAYSDYGIRVSGIVGKDNVYGCQFHPEKSGTAGLSILKSFCQLS